MDSIYPSETVDILQRPEDDDVSTLSGCSSSHHHNNDQSPSPSSSAAAGGETGQKRYHSSPLRNKTKLQPYLNGKLPTQVSAALKMCNHNKLGENRRKGTTTSRIPGAISISTTLSNENPILKSNRNSESDGVSKENESNNEHENIFNHQQSFFGNDNNSDKEKDVRPMDSQQTCSFFEKSSSKDNAMSDILACSDSRAASNRSPIKGNAARQQRLQRLRRLKIGDKQAFRKAICSSVDTVETKDDDASTTYHANLSKDSTSKSLSPEKDHTCTEDGISGGQSCQKAVDEIVKSSDNNNDSRVFDTRQDELVKPSLVKKQLHLTPTSKQSLLDTLSDVPAFLSREDTIIPRPTSSLAGLYNNISKSTPGRIHRSFWSVVEPDFHAVSEGRNNPQSISSITSSPSHGTSRSVTNDTNNRQSESGMLPSLNCLDNGPNSPSRRSTHSNNSWSTNFSGKSVRINSTEKSSPDRSAKSQESVGTSNKTGKSSPQRSTVSMSMKSFDDLYDGIIKQLQCETAKCRGGCESIDDIDEPPPLKRLMLASDLCSSATCYESSASGDSGSVVSSTTSSIFSDLVMKKRNSQGSGPAAGGVRSEKSPDTRVAESSMYDKFQLTPPGNDAMKHSDTYIAQISIGITGKSKPYFNNVIAELQKDLESAGITNDSVSIRVISPSDKAAPSTPADNTVLTRSTVSEECSIFNDSNSGHGSKVSASTIDTMTIFATDHKMPKEGNTKSIRQLRRSILSTPSRKIVKKIRKATDQMLRRTNQRRNSFKLGDEQHLLSNEDICDGQGPEEDPWHRSTIFPTSRPSYFDQGRYSKMAF